eukprot:TRINITY_DN9892_c0_g2_i2.p1 TRINITY_DN9892_c0_g2~~TRINITY_DN9892_c0_g2_i2.p1  ORF type:complete len:359 (-),score=48.02 TRINITY_DN9892_c0_g2_i2:216-1292(-)
MYTACFLIYNKVRIGEFTDFVTENLYPAALVLYFAVTLLWLGRRQHFGTTVLNVLGAPFGRVSMFTSFVGDWFTSLVLVFEDSLFTAFFIFSGRFVDICAASLWDTNPNGDCVQHSSDSVLVWWGFQHVLLPFCAFLPLWCRLAQNLRRYHDTHARFPHLANGFKYAFSLSVVFFGSFSPSLYDLQEGSSQEDIWRVVFLFCCILSTFYACWWDIRMDWGLLRQSDGLREQRLFPTRWLYWVAAAIDLVLRFGWTLTLMCRTFPFGQEFFERSGASFVLASLEIGRRVIWSCFRLENEHLSNFEGFRVVTQVPLQFNSPQITSQHEQPSKRIVITIVEISVSVMIIAVLCVVAATRKT